MKPVLRTIGFTVGFIFLVAFLTGLVTVIHGDCFADQQCVEQKRWISIIGLSIGAVAHFVLLVIVRPWKIEGDSN